MKLYFSPGACSLSPHIVLNELGLPFQVERVDTKNNKTASGRTYSEITPKGAVPALELDNGQVLTEGAVIVQYLADLKPEKKLLPPAGSFERVRAQEWLNYIATDIHKGFGPIFGAARLVQNAEGQSQLKANAKDALGKRFDYISERLGSSPYLLGSDFSVLDAYLFTVLNWSNYVELDLSRWPKLTAYMERVKSRESTKKALQAEGLNK